MTWILMKLFRAGPLLVVLFFSLSVAPVFANGYTVGDPIIGGFGAPALATGGLFAGAITVNYADGRPVVLASNHVTLELCATTCITLSLTLRQTAPGVYTYSFTPPSSLTGTVTIYVPAGGLADDNGRIFPSVDTSIGTYASPSLTSTSSDRQSPPPLAGTAPSTPSSEVDQAVNQSTPTQQESPLMFVLAALSLLAVAGLVLIFPRRR